MMSWVKIQDDWIGIWNKIRDVICFVDNLKPHSIGETTEIFIKILVEPVLKKITWKFSMYREKKQKIRVVTDCFECILISIDCFIIIIYLKSTCGW